MEILTYDPAYASDFARLNLDWISRYFVVEPKDEEILHHPEPYILKPGGMIFFARLEEKIVGTCALMHHGDGRYEVAKMGVDETVQGRGIGRKLMEAVLVWYRSRPNRKECYIISNRKLDAAMRLYRNMGFVEVPIRDRSYERVDIELVLNENAPALKQKESAAP